MLAPLAWQWRAADAAAPPRAAVGHGATATRLLARLAGMPAARRAALTATGTRDWLVVLGPSDDLPWVDGVRYAAPDPGAAGLWLPTHRTPTVAPDLLWTLLHGKHRRGPLLLWPDPAAVLPLDRQLPVDDTLLAALARHVRGVEAAA